MSGCRRCENAEKLDWPVRPPTGGNDLLQKPDKGSSTIPAKLEAGKGACGSGVWKSLRPSIPIHIESQEPRIAHELEGIRTPTMSSPNRTFLAAVAFPRASRPRIS